MTDDLALYATIGFLAQLIDGTLGMGYGVVSSTALLGMGLAPLQVSANVHLSEIVTTGATGIFHIRRGHVQWVLVRPLIIGGALGGIAGVVLLTVVSPLALSLLRRGVAAYLLGMGLLMVRRALRGPRPGSPTARPGLLGVIGGLFDAAGGGGWGSLVTSRMMMSGLEPRVAVGSSIAAEFAVTIVMSIAFVGIAQVQPGLVALGLIIGGVIAAPIAPLVAGRLPSRALLGLVGVAVILLSARVLLS